MLCKNKIKIKTSKKKSINKKRKKNSEEAK
jgi:hypothetical protein